MSDAEQPLPDDAALTLDSEREGDRALVRVGGELDAYTAPKLAELCASLFEAGVRDLRVNFRSTTFVDSSGLRALLVSHRTFVDGGGSLHVVDPSEAVRRLLEITGLSDQFGPRGSSDV